MDVKLASPVLETAPTPFELLGVAFPDSEWAEKQAEIKAKIEEERRKAEEEAAVKEEAEREARIKAEYDAAIPEEVSTRVSEALAQSKRDEGTARGEVQRAGGGAACQDSRAGSKVELVCADVKFSTA